MRVFITGGTGFIGKYTVDALLNRGFEVMMLVRNIEGNFIKHNNLYVVKGELSQIHRIKKQVKEFAPDTVVHLAWEGIPDYSFAMGEKNLLYGINLLKLCSEVKCKCFIGMGSCWEYETKQGMISENDQISAENGFKAVKNSLRLLSEGFCKENNIKFYWLRLFYVYGSGQKSTSLIPYIINCFKEGKQPELNGIDNANDFVYVKDVAKAIIEVIQKQPIQHIFNIGSGKAVQVLEVLKRVAKEMKVEVDVSLYKKQENPICFWADLNKITSLAEWKPQYDISEGIKEMVRYK